MDTSFRFTIVLFFGVFMLSSSLNLNAQNITASYQSFDNQNVLLFGCDYQQATTRMYINVINVTGGTGNYTVAAAGGGGVSSTSIKTGQGFTFYFTEQDQISGGIDFTITDSAGNTYDLDPLVKTQIELLQFSVCNTPAHTCQNNIIHSSNPIPVTVYNTSNYIKSTGKVVSPSNTTSYLATTLVELQSGFEVPINASFYADIEPCP